MITRKKILSAMLAISMLPGMGAFLTAGAQAGYTPTPGAAAQLMDGAFMDSAADISAWSAPNPAFVANADGAEGVLQAIPNAGGYISIHQSIPMKYGSWYKIRARVKMIDPSAECTDAGFLPVGFAENSSQYIANRGGNNGQMKVSGQDWTELYTYYNYIGLNGSCQFGEEHDVNFMLRLGQSGPGPVGNGVYVDYFTVEEVKNGDDLIIGGSFDDPQVLKGNNSDFVPEPWFTKNGGYDCEPFIGTRNNSEKSGWTYTWNPGDAANPSPYITVESGEKYPTLTQNIRLKKGQKYLLSARVRAWIEGKDTTGAEFFLLNAEYNTVQNFNPPQALGSKWVNTGEWTEVYQTYTYEGAFDFVDVPFCLRVGQYDNQDGWTIDRVDIDSFSVIPIQDEDAFVAGGELNSAYELANWGIGGATASMVTTADGPAAKLVPTANSNFMQMSQSTKDFVADQWYKVSARAKLLPNNDGSAARTATAGFLLKSDGFDYTYITSDGGQDHGDTIVTSDEWADIYAYFRYTGVPWNAAGQPQANSQILFRIGTHEIANVANGAYVDYIRIEPLESSNILMGSGFDDPTLVNGTSAKEKIYPAWGRKSTGYETEIWNGLKNKYLKGAAEWRSENGNGYLHMTNKLNESYYCVSQLVSLKAGKTYIARARVRPALVEEFAGAEEKDLPKSDFMMTDVEGAAAVYNDIAWKNVITPYDEWTTVERLFTIPADVPTNDYGNVATTLQLRVAQQEMEKVVNGVDIDDITLEEVEFTVNKPVLNIQDLHDLSDVRASFTATSTYSNKDVTVFVASYDENGRLVGVDAENITIAAGREQTYTTKAMQVSEQAAGVKVMVWDANAQAPYTESTELKDSNKVFF